MIVFHLTFWSAIIALTLNYVLKELEIIDAIFLSFYTSFLAAVPFYINYFLFSRFLFRKQNFFYYFALIIALILVPLFIINFTEFGYLLIDDATYNQSLDLVINYVFVILVSNLIRGTEVWMYNRQRQQQIEKEKLQAELNFLRIQINPHFLFNTLNNIYSLAYTKDDKAAPMIAKLSQIMRYMLNDCKESRVELKKEIGILKNYIDLQLLKIGQDRNIDLYSEGININHKVAPLIFITLLENCFKHGDIEMNEKGWIKVECIVEDDCLNFNISNSISNNEKASSSVASSEEGESSGIGLSNIRKQLELNYPDNFEINIEELESEYNVKLKIKLD